VNSPPALLAMSRWRQSVVKATSFDMLGEMSRKSLKRR